MHAHGQNSNSKGVCKVKTKAEPSLPSPQLPGLLPGGNQCPLYPSKIFQSIEMLFYMGVYMTAHTVLMYSYTCGYICNVKKQTTQTSHLAFFTSKCLLELFSHHHIQGRLPCCSPWFALIVMLHWNQFLEGIAGFTGTCDEIVDSYCPNASHNGSTDLPPNGLVSLLTLTYMSPYLCHSDR